MALRAVHLPVKECENEILEGRIPLARWTPDIEIDEGDQTYKLKKDSKSVPVLFLLLPLNTDLRKKPQIILDQKKIGNTTYLHCNQNIGCKTIAILNEDLLNNFKKAKTMTVAFGIFSNDKNLVLQFPLKGFTKAYKKLTK